MRFALTSTNSLEDVAKLTITANANSSFPGAFSDIHNHTNNVPPSPGDVYGLLGINKSHAQFNTRYVLDNDGIIYALAITDRALATSFFEKYHFPPGDQNAFPDPLFDEWSDITNDSGSTPVIALSFILNKYNSGVALMKQDNSGNFHKLGATENSDSNGHKTYSANDCN